MKVRAGGGGGVNELSRATMAVPRRQVPVPGRWCLQCLPGGGLDSEVDRSLGRVGLSPHSSFPRVVGLGDSVSGLGVR